MVRRLCLLVALSVAAACSGPGGQGSSTSGTAGATGGGASASGTGADSSSGGAGTSGETSGSAGGSTGGMPDAGSDGGCDGLDTEFQPCGGNGGVACECNQECLADPFFAALIASSSAIGVCESPCTSNLDCQNAASVCGTLPGGPSFCGPNECDGGVGVACPANDGTLAGGPGTCVVQSEHGLSLCMPDGTAQTCDLENVLGNDDPQASEAAPSLFPQAATDSSLFCGAGQACFGYNFRNAAAPFENVCAQLCLTSSDAGCPGSNVCLTQDGDDTSWGFCQACLPAEESESLCYLDSDCCQGARCYRTGTGGSCCDFGLAGDPCAGDADCCGTCVQGLCN